MNTITPLQPVPTVGPISSRQGGRGQAEMLPEPGQIFKALVLDARSGGQFLLQFGNTELLARSEAPLQTGQTLQLQVTSTSPQIELKIVADPLSQLFGRSIALVGKNIDIATLFTALQQQTPPLLESLSPTSRQTLESYFSLQQQSLGEKDGGVVLKQLIDRLGLSLENLLAHGDTTKAPATLKAALLDIMNSFRNAETISDHTSRILTSLELFQMAQLQVDSSKQFIFPLPLPMIENGYLLIERNDGDEDGDGPGQRQDFRMSLHLTMTDLGHLRVDFVHAAEGLFIRFHTDSTEKAEFIAAAGDQLRQAISDLPLLGLTFASDAEDPVAELIRRMVPAGSAIVDTKA